MMKTINNLLPPFEIRLMNSWTLLFVSVSLKYQTFFIVLSQASKTVKLNIPAKNSTCASRNMFNEKTTLAVGYFIYILVIVIFGFVKYGDMTALRIKGSVARCEKEGEIVRPPFLEGNPCITCLCENKSIRCRRVKCPVKKCKGTLIRTTKSCCSDCIESLNCLHKGRIYQNDHTWLEKNCTSCSCHQGKVVCGKQQCRPEQLTCPKGQQAGLVPGACCLQCIEATAACYLYGDFHYTTFDSRMYHFHGTCKYLLTSDCLDSKFSVQLRNTRRPSQKHSKVKQVSVHLDGIVITLSRNFLVRVNKGKVTLPFYDLPRYQITRRDTVLSVRTDFGLQVLWDGDSYMEVIAPKKLQGRLCGLCGNFNGNAEDDFRLRNGTQARNTEEFGNDWKLGNGRKCTRTSSSSKFPCKNLTKWLKARHQCSALKSSETSVCYSKVKPNPYYTSCISDVCECKFGVRCACASLMAYVRACRRRGVILRWRSKTSCRVLDHETFCPGGAVHSECMSPCRRTCDKFLNSNTTRCEQPCFPGCQCPAGTVWHGNSCIQTSVCLSTRKN